MHFHNCLSFDNLLEKLYTNKYSWRRAWFSSYTYLQFVLIICCRLLQSRKIHKQTYRLNWPLSKIIFITSCSLYIWGMIKVMEAIELAKTMYILSLLALLSKQLKTPWECLARWGKIQEINKRWSAQNSEYLVNIII